MARSDEVAKRVHDLIAGFPRYVAAFEQQAPVTGQRLRAHRATIELRQQAESVQAAVNNPQFVASLQRTLVAWRLGMRRSQLARGTAFEDALGAALPEITALEPLRIDADDLPADTPNRLWDLIDCLGVTDNNAKIVAGTKTLHHLLPDLVPPMDRWWTGRFFKRTDPEWQGQAQRDTFLELYGWFRRIAQQVDPRQYVTGQGWWTSRTKVLDNALIGYCETESTGTIRDDATGQAISFRVEGYPPAKDEALSLLGGGHPHATRVRALLICARQALQAHQTFTPVADGPVALDLVVYADPERQPWDATNYLGGVADVLEDKVRRGTAMAHLGELAGVWLYRNDRQIKKITYREETGTTVEYIVTIRAM